MQAKAHEKFSMMSEKYKNKSPGSWTSNWPFWTQSSFSFTNWTANAIMNGIAKIPEYSEETFFSKWILRIFPGVYGPNPSLISNESQLIYDRFSDNFFWICHFQLTTYWSYNQDTCASFPIFLFFHFNF